MLHFTVQQIFDPHSSFGKKKKIAYWRLVCVSFSRHNNKDCVVFGFGLLASAVFFSNKAFVVFQLHLEEGMRRMKGWTGEDKYPCVFLDFSFRVAMRGGCIPGEVKLYL
jgi:hypothetical protein